MMRVILKPGGIMFIAAAVGLLSLLVFLRPKNDAVTGQPVSQTVPDETRIATGDMETFIPVTTFVKNGKAKIAGQVATGFIDNSDWADLAIDYSKDTGNPHGGSGAQKIAVGNIAKGQAQFNRDFSVPVGTKVKAVVWLRADKSLPVGDVQLALRNRDIAEKWYAQRDVAVGTEWQRYEIVGTTVVSTETYFMLIVRKAGVSVYVDDVSITKQP